MLYYIYIYLFLKKQDFNRAVITLSQESECSDWLKGPQNKQANTPKTLFFGLEYSYGGGGQTTQKLLLLPLQQEFYRDKLEP